MHYLLEPLDVALFRDGRPFSPGEFLRAQPLGYIPIPQTIYGALRGLILHHKNISYRKFHEASEPPDIAVGTLKKLGNLEIRGPFLAVVTDDSFRLYLPCPADLARVGRPRQQKWGFQRPSPEEAINNYPCKLHPLAPRKWDTGRNSWVPCGVDEPVSYEMEAQLLPAGDLYQYLTGQGPITVPVTEYVKTETHVGIERCTETLRPETGMIYSVEFHRLAFRKPAAGGWQAESAAYAVEVIAPQDCLPEDTIFAVGGERRPFRIRRVEWRDWFGEQLRQSVSQYLIRSCISGGVCRFRLYLLTPARFRSTEAWIPDFLGDSDPDFEWTLAAAAVPRAIPYSGWDLARSRPRDGCRLVPAGSVYFVEAKAKTSIDSTLFVEKLMNKFWLGSVLGAKSEDDRKMGFGLTLIGGWSYAG